jgi:hypothetical protein
MARLIIYIAGPYRGDVYANMARARDVALGVWRAGHIALCPHLNTAFFDFYAPEIPDERWLEGTLRLMARCDGVVATDDWERSSGARQEVALAKELRLPVWVWPDLPEAV